MPSTSSAEERCCATPFTELRANFEKKALQASHPNPYWPNVCSAETPYSQLEAALPTTRCTGR
eukprot:1004755-Lingulodinium_polyedra.AAC.1